MGSCNILSLKDGCQLAFVEYGAANGRPVFFFHGWPSSRTMAELTDSAARHLNLRIISADRPGICDSTFQPNRQLLDWPDVVRQFADHLGVERQLAAEPVARQAAEVPGLLGCEPVGAPDGYFFPGAPLDPDLFVAGELRRD